ncbi:MAG TPA: transcription termination/antitermination factor NusG [Candidatus Pelethenecus faecipullorum]|uniref:Transcription termination/antitermination protein NusG n=1 Tax=Candidatus Pelethenecus faecipullorum TaxID=2840900 RepID=A0A9D1GPV7_9MOLU|nr:transcription termination/antitermination factor NusG [Candidatus Pelethenecus faecipullorum]
MSRRWYIVGTYSGYENSVKQDLERRMETMNMTDKIYQVIVPEETTQVVDKKGKKKEKVTKMFPGYVFVEMEVDKEMDEKAWFMIRNTPKVTGFLGSSGGGTKPVPVPVDEMNRILISLGMVEKPSFELKVKDKIEVIEGPFSGRVFEIAAVNEETEEVTVLVELFGGRSTQMSFQFKQIKKI